jgi:transcription elongation GreA/GreB family factor
MMNHKVVIHDANGIKYAVKIELKDGKLSIYSNGGGQCQDHIKPANADQTRLIDIWNEWHLNDMHAGTPEQEAYLKAGGFKDYGERVAELKKAGLYEVNGYKYGTGWLTRALPATLEDELQALIYRLEKTEQTREDESASETEDEKLSRLMDENGIDEDMTDACRAYLDVMNLDDLDDFEEAYQGQYDSDEDFAQSLAEDMGAIDPKSSWPNNCIDWEQAARDLMRKIMRTPILEEMDKRALLARAIKARPELQELLEATEDKTSTETVPAAKMLTVSWASLERRKKDYDELVNVRIPANSRDIQVAREQGDLRENAGFKFAKEQQGVLMRQKAELEHQLANCRGTNFENPDTSRVSLGSTVRLRDSATGAEEELHILGAWDGNSAKNIVSYLAAAATSLIGHAAGETVRMPSETGERDVTIVSIEPFKNLEIL